MKKTTSMRHKSTSSESFIQKYLAIKQHGDAYSNTLYDPSLIMHSLQHTLQKTTSHLDQLKRQRHAKPPTAPIQQQENQKQPRHSSSFLKNRMTQPSYESSPKRNSTLLQILLKNVPNEHPLKEKYPELKQRQLVKKNQSDELKSQISLSEKHQKSRLLVFQACKGPRELWKKDQIKKLLQNKVFKPSGMFRQSSLILQKHPSSQEEATKKQSCPGRHSQIAFRTSTETEQPNHLLKLEKKLIPIMVKPYPFSRLSINPAPMVERKLQKHSLILNKKNKVQHNQLDTSIDRSSGFGETADIEPWGAGSRVVVVEEVHSDWHGLV